MSAARRPGVGKPEDRWYKTVRDPVTGAETTVPSANHGKGLRWQVRYVGFDGKPRQRSFRTKTEAQAWATRKAAEVVSGTVITPADEKTTVRAWCARWLRAYETNEDSTVRQAKTHVALINAAFGDRLLSDIRPTDVRMWLAQLRKPTAEMPDGYAPSYVYALHSRLSQVMSDAVHDGVVGRNPCSKRTAPPAPKKKPYVITDEQMWAIHDAMPQPLRPAVLLGAFAGLRVAEVSGLLVADLDLMRGWVHVARQWDKDYPKTSTSCASVPIPADVCLELSASIATFPSATGHAVIAEPGMNHAGPWAIERAIRDIRDDIDGLEPTFVFHDLRHWYASRLIAEGLDILEVQARMRHGSAKTTLDTYGHLFPNQGERTRSAMDGVLARRAAALDARAGQMRDERPGS